MTQLTDTFVENRISGLLGYFEKIWSSLIRDGYRRWSEYDCAWRLVAQHGVCRNAFLFQWQCFPNFGTCYILHQLVLDQTVFWLLLSEPVWRKSRLPFCQVQWAANGLEDYEESDFGLIASFSILLNQIVSTIQCDKPQVFWGCRLIHALPWLTWF